jgi:hypothetical protein
MAEDHQDGAGLAAVGLVAAVIAGVALFVASWVSFRECGR